MSLKTTGDVHVLHCDRCGAESPGPWPMRSTWRLLDFAERAGWQTSSEGDFCPQCKNRPGALHEAAQEALHWLELYSRSGIQIAEVSGWRCGGCDSEGIVPSAIVHLPNCLVAEARDVARKVHAALKASKAEEVKE